MIEFEKVTFRYRGSDRPALNGVDLNIRAGEMFLIVGFSGSGKTTLARLMAGSLGPDEGEIVGRVKVEGEEIIGARRQELADRVGLVQQDPESQVVTLNVEDEIAFGLENLGFPVGEIKERIEEVLDAVGSRNLQDRSVNSLSGGELQRIAIASILALRPRVLILDEPTSSLDPPSIWQLGQLLGELNKAGQTIVVIEHRYSWILPRCSRIADLHEGQINRVLAPSMIDGMPSEPPDDGRTDRSPGNTVVSLRDVSFDYDGREALSRVSLDLREGEILGLMGDNGSGKTTLLMVILGILKPTKGCVLLRGVPVGRTSDLARNVGLVFQNPNHQIFESTVMDEVLFGPRNFGLAEQETRSKANALLQGSGLAEHAHESPHRLSMGEKRRLNVASVAVYEPRIFLLDEPFVGQDRANVDRIMDLMRCRAKQGSSVLLVAHDPDLIAHNCDRMAFLEAGKVAAVGEPRKVFSYLGSIGQVWYLPSGWR